MYNGVLKVLFIILSFFSTKSISQEIVFEKKFSRTVWNFSGTTKHPHMSLLGNTIKISDGHDIIKDLTLIDSRFKKQVFNCNLELPQTISINGCTIIRDTVPNNTFTICDEDDTALTYIDKIVFNFNTVSNNANLNFLNGKGAEVHMSGNTINDATFTLKKGKILFLSNDVKGNLRIVHSDLDLFIIAGCNFKSEKKNEIRIDGSRINAFQFETTRAKKLELNAMFSTFDGIITLSSLLSKEIKKKGNLSVSFSKCTINSQILSNQTSEHSKLSFEECKFGPGANLNEVGFDTIIFKNCYNIGDPILLSSPKKKHKILLSLINSNVTNIKFDYTGQYLLYFDSISKKNEELVRSTYENLLAKFKIEGKNLSYQNLDIEYQEYKYSKLGLVGKIQNFIDRNWWFYSYRKYYIIYWTLGFLMLFFILNLILYTKVQEVYPIIPETKKSYYQLRNIKLSDKFKSGLNVFIYTAFIFLSLRVDFDKLNYRSPKLLIYFFLQYIIGLVCVFFIANAILKI